MREKTNRTELQKDEEDMFVSINGAADKAPRRRSLRARCGTSRTAARCWRRTWRPSWERRRVGPPEDGGGDPDRQGQVQPLGQGEGKLEQSLNEAEDALERKSNGSVEKIKRKKALGNLGTKYRAKVR